MAEKDLGINVTGDISDIQEKLSTLVDEIGKLTDKAIDITFNVDNSAITTATEEITRLDNTTVDVQVNDTSIEQLSANASIASTELSETAGAASEVATEVMIIDSTAINEAASAASALGSNFEGASRAADEVATEVMIIDSTAINEAASAASALGSNFEGASNEADNFSTSAGGASNSTSDFSTSTNEASSSTSEFAGVMSGVSGMLGGFGSQLNSTISGVSNMASQLAEGAISAELFAAALAAVIAVGIVVFLAEATEKAGQFNDSWSRLQQAVGEGGQAMTNVKDEWTSAINTMKDETGRSAGLIREHIISMGTAGVTSKDLIIDSFSGISGAAFVTGNDISTIENAFKRIISSGMLSSRQLIQFGITTDDVMKATGLTMDQVRDKFKNLDTDGRTALLNLILTQKYGESANNAYKLSWQHVGDAMKAAWDYILIAVGQIILPIVVPALNLLTSALKFVADGITWVTSGFNNLNLGMGKNQILFTVLTAVLTGFNPVLTAIAFIVGTVADNWGRLSQAVSDFITSIQSGDWGNAAQIIVNQFQWAADAIVQFFITIPQRIGEYASRFYDLAKDMMNWIISGLYSLSDWLDKQLALMLAESAYNSGAGMKDGLSQWLDDNGWKIEEIISDFFLQLVPKLIEVGAKVILLIGAKILQLAIQKVNDILIQIKDSIVNFFLNLPGNMYNAGAAMIQAFIDGMKDKLGPFKDILQYISDHWPKSPAKIGPLSEVTPSGMYGWASDVMDGANSALSDYEPTLNDSLQSVTDNFNAAVGMTLNETSTDLGVDVNVLDKGTTKLGVNLGNTMDKVVSKFGASLNSTVQSVAKKLGSLNISIPSSTSTVSNKSTSNNNVNIDLRGSTLNGVADLKTAGTIAGKAALKSIDGDAINNGVSVINYLR